MRPQQRARSLRYPDDDRAHPLSRRARSSSTRARHRVRVRAANDHPTPPSPSSSRRCGPRSWSPGHSWPASARCHGLDARRLPAGRPPGRRRCPRLPADGRRDRFVANDTSPPARPACAAPHLHGLPEPHRNGKSADGGHPRRRRTTIVNAACEPEIVCLGNMLNRMGARINGLGSPTITVDGVDRLHGVSETMLPDRLEAGTFAIGAVITSGEVTLERCARAGHAAAHRQAARGRGGNLGRPRPHARPSKCRLARRSRSRPCPSPDFRLISRRRSRC